jgi:hypothetical protein
VVTNVSLSEQLVRLQHASEVWQQTKSGAVHTNYACMDAVKLIDSCSTDWSTVVGDSNRIGQPV